MAIPRFIVIDDDKFNNALCTMVIGKIWKEAQVVTFHDPIAGLKYLTNEYTTFTAGEPAILLLDINMPYMDGWELMDKFNLVLKQRNETITDRLTIYMLSSSVDKKDIDKAHLYPNVTNYLIKPITKDTIYHITGTEKK